MKVTKDKVFNDKKKDLKNTMAFLRAIKSKLSAERAIEISNEAAANYMIAVYEEVFKDTQPGTQKRFDTFRAFYEAHPKKSPYCEILESTNNCLKVRFNRCPHAEILTSEGLFEFAESSCLSDIAFTNKLMPGIEFTRESSIVEGDYTCVMEWKKISK
jgi:hypothetical protein